MGKSEASNDDLTFDRFLSSLDVVKGERFSGTYIVVDKSLPDFEALLGPEIRIEVLPIRVLKGIRREKM
jgi:hypothetical protein